MNNCKNKVTNLRVCVSGGHSSGNDPIYEEQTYEMGRLIAKLGFRLDYGFSLEAQITSMQLRARVTLGPVGMEIGRGKHHSPLPTHLKRGIGPLISIRTTENRRF